MQNFFALFSLAAQFDIDATALEKHYRVLQAQTHPDHFVNADAATQLQAMQTATLANEAYQTLKNPAKRAAYLLQLQGIDILNEQNTRMPMDFLTQQLEWREAIAEAEAAQDILGIEKTLSTLQAEAKKFQQALSEQFAQNDLSAAGETTRKLIFMQKVCADIDVILEKLEEAA